MVCKEKKLKKNHKKLPWLVATFRKCVRFKVIVKKTPMEPFAK